MMDISSAIVWSLGVQTCISYDAVASMGHATGVLEACFSCPLALASLWVIIAKCTRAVIIALCRYQQASHMLRLRGTLDLRLEPTDWVGADASKRD